MHFPSEFIQEIQSLLSDETSRFLKALEEAPPTSIRINKSKIETKQSFEKVEWSYNGYYLPERPSFTSDPLFHAGCYYPQEASSMFLEQVIKQYVGNRNIKALDLCAAPGGKSTHLLTLISEKSLLLSNEVIRSRANILSENIIKSGYSNVVVSNNDPVVIGNKLPDFFDLILVDAPCSGEGMFRKDPAAIDEWSLSNVKLCAARQQRIISDVWSSLKPGGLLVYSTCTYNMEEDEENVSWICNNLGANSLEVSASKEWGIINSFNPLVKAYRFMPHRTRGEGFFIAVLQKNDENIISSSTERNHKNRKTKSKNPNKLKTPNELLDYIIDSDKYDFELCENEWYAFLSEFNNDLDILKRSLKIVSYGIFLGEFKGKDFAPSHNLALSNILNKKEFETINVPWEIAISYLKKEPLQLEESTPKGYVLLIYKNIPIGFVKNIGNRANNLYPQEWRIRTNKMLSEPVGIRV